MNHLDALNLRLSNERARLSSAKSQAEIELRKVWIAQIEKEIGDEAKFSGEVSDDQLLADLGL